MPKVSVIIPCLNMQKYIGICVESITRQTLSELEILVVDAGSTDGTLDILDDFVKADERIRVIHSAKKSYGYQVNLGIQEAVGQYIAFVDADDKIAENMYEVLYENAVGSDADYVKGTAKSFYTISENLMYYRPLMQFPKEEYQDGKIALVPADRADLLTKDNYLWNGIYRQGFMKDILLHESAGAAFQDLGGLLQAQMRAQKAIYLEESFYEYRQDNITASGHDPRGFQFIWDEYSWAERFIEKASHEWKVSFYRKLFLHTLSKYSAMAASGEFWKEAEVSINRIRKKIKTELEKGTIRECDFTGNERENLEIFLKDGYGLYDKYCRQYLLGKQQLAKIPVTAGKREIVIFGFGEYGMFVSAQIIKHDLGKVAAYCDNRTEKQHSCFPGIPILNPSEAVSMYKDSCFVIANKNHSEDMKKQLMSMGIEETRISEYTAGVDMGLFREQIGKTGHKA